MQSNSVKSNKKSEYAKLSVTLLAITFVVALLLAVVNYATAPKIAEINQQKLNDAMAQVLPEGKHFEDITNQIKDLKVETPILSMMVATNDNDELVGYCVEVAPKGYSDEIDMMVGLNAQGEVTNTSIISISDTPGIGTQVQDASFAEQFIGKSEIIAVKGDAVGTNEVSLISGATYSSSGYANGVDAALKAYASVAKEEQK